jgi:molybdopterin-guanine dinucleotide biosynthesis protein A
MTKRVAIILAGGKGQRFQTKNSRWQDKALADLWGKPLLVRAVESVRDVVDEVVIVVKDQMRKIEYGKVLETFGVKDASLITDLDVKGLSGPLIAIYTGLTFSEADYALTVPSDVPLLSRKVVDYLFAEMKNSYVGVPMWPNSRLETLLMTLNRKICVKITEALCQLGRSHPDDIIRGAQKVLFVSPLGEIKKLDPELKSFVNINFQEDLSRLQPRQGQGATVENIRLNLGEPPLEEIPLILEASKRKDNRDFLSSSEMFADCATRLEKKERFFWAALSREQQAKTQSVSTQQAKDAFLKAAQNYFVEAKVYEENRCFLLAERARSDAAWIQRQIK